MHSRLSSLLLIGLLFAEILFFYPVVQSSTVDKILGQNFYFHRELSGIGDYRVLNTIYPTLSDRKNITNYAPIGTWEFGDGWISPEVPRNITLERAYNFLFSVWGAGSGKASIFFKFYAYRNNMEYFLFSSNPSEQLIINATEMLWQHKTKEVTLEIKEGDMLVLRIFVNVSVAGTFGLGYDCSQYPSYVNDPTETRYMRSDTQTINGLTAYKLGTAQSSSQYSSAATGSSEDSYTWGIGVWKRDSAGTETEITSGTPVAQVSGSSTGLKSATWSCPQTSLASTDAIVTRVYVNVSGGAWTLKVTFITEQVGASQLDSATWTVYYYISYTVSVKLDISSSMFRFGISTYNSRIENFTWSEAPAGEWQTVSTWTFQLPTRQWNNVGTWAYQLLTRQWNNISWSFQLATRAWSAIGTWLFQLDVKGWHTIATWLFIFESTPEVNVIPILFLFTAIGALLIVAKKRIKCHST